MMRGVVFLTALSALFGGSAALADAPSVRRVPVQPPATAPAPSLPGRVLKRACVPVDSIAGAIVTDDRSIELRLKGGARWRMRFAEACPALGYYEGFYYRRARAGYLCAGHDAVIARSGGECPIADLTRIGKPRRK